MVLDDQVLGAKEQKEFRQIPKLHEQKQFKRALKIADGILKTHPNHADTICLKALTLNYLNKKEEAFPLCKLGLMKSKMKSYMAWHIYGLLYRSDRNYTEAIKCYRMSLKCQEYSNVLKDLGVLQIQTRDVTGYAETRKQLLMQFPGQRTNWIGFSLAHHMCGNYKLALQVLDTCLGFIKDNDKDSYEQSEMLLYKATLLKEMGDINDVLTFLDTFNPKIVDKIGLLQLKGNACLNVNKFKESRVIFEELLKYNPECYDYHRGLQASILKISDISKMEGSCDLPISTQLNSKELNEMKAVYKELRSTYPRNFACRRIPLDFLSGSDFEEEAHVFLKNGFRKGVPALFSTLRPIYKLAYGRRSVNDFTRNSLCFSDIEIESAKERVHSIGKIVQGYLDSLKSSEKFSADEDDKEVPTVYLWCLFFMAQHFDMIHEQDKGLVLINEALQHTPTLVDLYFVKGRLLKHLGDFENAAEVLNEGRQLDLADKWINSKTAKYYLRAGKIKEGEEVISLFTKHEGNHRDYIMEMQTMWYELEVANCSLNEGNYPMALKFFKTVFKHFDDIEDDQLEFHNYCLRKFTLNSYVEMLRFVNKHRNHRFFNRAAHGAVKCYIDMHDLSSEFDDFKEQEEPDLTKMTSAERKKYKLKMRKKEAKMKKNEELKKEAEESTNISKEDGDDDNKTDKKSKRKRDFPLDKDPDGVINMKDEIKDPLKCANKLLFAVNTFSPDNLQTHLDTFDVAVRRKKYLQAIKALYAAVELAKAGKEHPEIFWRLMAFFHFVLEKKSISYAPWAGKSTSVDNVNMPVEKSIDISPVVYDTLLNIASEFDISDTKSQTVAFYKKYSKQNNTDCDIMKFISAGKAMLLIDPSSRESIISSAVSCTISSSIRVEAYCAMDEYLKKFGASKESLEMFRKNVKQNFPNCKFT